MYRYVDTTIKPCVYLEDTLNARLPVVPIFLTAQGSFQTMIETEQQLGSCPRLGSGSAGEEQGAPPEALPSTSAAAATHYCGSCKKVKQIEDFDGNKTCTLCLGVRKSRYVSSTTRLSKLEAEKKCNKALYTALTEAMGSCAQIIESLSWELVGKDCTDTIQEVKEWILKVHRRMSRLTTESELGSQFLILTIYHQRGCGGLKENLCAAHLRCTSTAGHTCSCKRAPLTSAFTVSEAGQAGFQLDP